MGNSQLHTNQTSSPVNNNDGILVGDSNVKVLSNPHVYTSRLHYDPAMALRPVASHGLQKRRYEAWSVPYDQWNMLTPYDKRAAQRAVEQNTLRYSQGLRLFNRYINNEDWNGIFTNKNFLSSQPDADYVGKENAYIAQKHLIPDPSQQRQRHNIQNTLKSKLRPVSPDEYGTAEWRKQNYSNWNTTRWP